MHQVRIQLENALLECQIENPAARSFWQTQFRTGGSEGNLMEEVPWERFCTELAKETGAPLFDIRALDQMFGSQQQPFFCNFICFCLLFGF